MFGHPGLLVGACVNRAPEGLLGAAVAEVGVLDLLKVSLVNSLFVFLILIWVIRLVRRLHHWYVRPESS